MRPIKDIAGQTINALLAKGQPKAIDTYYAKRFFRSRLEARWAVFFDALKIEWDYEREGYELGGIRYLPDFWLPGVYLRRKADVGLWVEIKPTVEEMKENERKFFILDKPVVVFVGAPPGYDDNRGVEGGFEYRNENIGGYTDSAMRIMQCRACVDKSINHWSRTQCDCGGVLADWFDEAVEAALSMRF